MKAPGKDTSMLVIGLGSIGQRHLRNLYHLGYTELYAVSSGKGTLPTEALPLKATARQLDEALDRFDPAAVFICNPTAMHLADALTAAAAGKHIFMEKPVAVSMDGLDALNQLVKDKQLTFSTGFQYRQHPTLQSVKQLVEHGRLGRIHAVRMHWGEYLPAWHPWEDHRKSYSAQEDLGGGVTFTLCHPLDYLRWMFGDAKAVSADIRASGALDITVDDIHNSTWEFENGVMAAVHLNYLERPPAHRLTIAGSRGKIVWSNEDGIADLFEEGRLAVRIRPGEGFERNHLFIAELRDFLGSIAANRQPACTLGDGIANLRMILASKQSAEEGRKVPLAPGKSKLGTDG
jgi:predicted dehydrogenase